MWTKSARRLARCGRAMKDVLMKFKKERKKTQHKINVNKLARFRIVRTLFYLTILLFQWALYISMALCLTMVVNKFRFSFYSSRCFLVYETECQLNADYGIGSLVQFFRFVLKGLSWITIQQTIRNRNRFQAYDIALPSFGAPLLLPFSTDAVRVAAEAMTCGVHC